MICLVPILFRAGFSRDRHSCLSLEIGRFSGKCSGRRPLLPSGAPAGRQTVAQGTPGAGAAGGALGHQSHHLFPLPQHVFCVGGEGQGEGARPCPLVQIMLRAEKHLENNETRDSESATNPLSPTPNRVVAGRVEAGRGRRPRLQHDSVGRGENWWEH